MLIILLAMLINHSYFSGKHRPHPCDDQMIDEVAICQHQNGLTINPVMVGSIQQMNLVNADPIGFRPT
jgi:hypothetical protein